MAKILKIGLYATFIFSLNACTSVVWNGGIYDADRAINTSTVIQATQSDQIYAFGRIPTSQADELAGSLLMMGEDYWYAIQPAISTQMLAPLSANLPQRYQITAPYSHEVLNALPVVVTDGSHFSSDFCLDYHAQTPKEHATLRQLKFQTQAQANHYRQCYAIVGTIYSKPDHFPSDYRFQKSVPVQLTMQQHETHIQTNKLARNILLTPLALAIDTASGIAMLPILMIGDLF